MRSTATFRDLNALVRTRRDEFERVLPYAKPTVYGEVSPSWKTLFGDRPNFLTPDMFHTFRSPQVAAIYGVGGHKESEEAARQFDQTIAEVVDAQDIPDAVIAAIGEPLLGSPAVRPYRGNLFSTPFLNNLASAWRTASFARRFCARRPLRICEIGAGFGATAQILHQMLEIESYTVIDLPENLYLSSVFLPATLPGRSHQVVDGHTAESLGCRHQLNFSLASFTDLLTPMPFDVVINRASMGEMVLFTAQAYIRWIGKSLDNDGIFHFHNRFNYGAANGAARLSDYGLQALGFRHIGAMERMTRPTNQIHTECVVSRSQGAAIQAGDLDVIGDLFACGFDPEAADLVASALSGAVTAETRAAIAALGKVLAPGTAAEKRAFLAAPHVPDDIRALLTAALDLLAGVDPAQATSAVFSRALDLKIEVRLRGLCAERQAAAGDGTWRNTLAPLRGKAPGLAAMSERLVRNGSFTPAFRRDLRLAP